VARDLLAYTPEIAEILREASGGGQGISFDPGRDLSALGQGSSQGGSTF